MQEEISLREIIQTVWDGKWIISIITVVAVLLAGFYSVFALSPTYEVQSIVRVGNGSAQQDLGQNLGALAVSLTSDVAMKRVIDKLNLDEGNYSINSIRNSINVEVVEDTSVMKLKVKGSDPSRITNVANIMAFELGSRIEIADRSQKIVDSRKQIEDLNDTIAVTQASIEVAKAQLAQTPEKLITKQSLANQPYLQGVLKDSMSIESKDMGSLQLESEEINPVYTALNQTITTSSIDLSRQQSEKSNLEKIVQENSQLIDEIEKKIETEKLNAMSSERLLNGFSAVFISPAIVPVDPVGPNKRMNVAISAVIGIILSMMVVFIRHYWRNSASTEPQHQGKSLTN